MGTETNVIPRKSTPVTNRMSKTTTSQLLSDQQKKVALLFALKS